MLHVERYFFCYEIERRTNAVGSKRWEFIKIDVDWGTCISNGSDDGKIIFGPKII